MSEISRKDFLGMGTIGAAGLAAGCAPGSGDGPASVTPDLIVTRANVLTQDDANPVAEAFAVKDGRFVAVGSADDVMNLAAANTEVIDAAGMTVVPGFIDAHSHPSGAGLNALKNVNTNLGSIAAIQEALRGRARSTPPGEWIVGYMYDDTKQEEGRPLNRRDLDAVSTDHPIVVGHRGGHTGVYNSKAFELAGVSAETPDPFGGHFEHENGELTGKVAERARAVFNVPNTSTREERAAGVAKICQEMNAAGLTSVHSAGTSADAFTAYQDAYEAGDLTFRMTAMARGGSFPALMEAGVRSGFGDEWLRVGAVKFAADGSASERTMAMSTPYEGRPDDYGILTMTQEQVHDVVDRAHQAGWQIAIHANGDIAIDMVLNAYERAQQQWPREDPRHRIEHCSLVNPSLLQRIADGGYIPAPFYTYAHYHGEKWIEYGEEKMEWMFAHKSFLDYGIPVAPASDHQPGPYEPLMALQSMVTRKDFAGRVWGPSQRITLDQALKVCTVNGAYASFEENEKGTITAGKLGDFVILAQDPHDVNPDLIKTIPVARTVVGEGRSSRRRGTMPRRIRYSVAMSLDGFIADEAGGYDWIPMDDEIDFATYVAKIDAYIMGRHTYELVQSQPDTDFGWADKAKYVVSTTLDASAVAEDFTLVSDDVEDYVRDLKSRDGKDIWLFGGGVLFRSLLEAGLVDRVEVAVIPALLGAGIKLLPGLEGTRTLTLHSVEDMPRSGIVLMKYDVEPSKC